MKKSKLFLILALVLSMAVGLGGTLAYLTDTDEAVNVMTLGNVQIEQIELQRAEGVAYNATAVEGSLEEYDQWQALYPAYPVNGAEEPYEAAGNGNLFKWGSYVTADNDTGAAGNGLWDDSKLKGVMDKFVFVKNTGDSDCYFRTWIAYECPEGITVGEVSNGAEIMFNVNGGYDGGNTILGYDTINVDGESIRFAIYCMTYTRENGVLPAGEIARPSLLQVVMTHHATNEDMEKLGKTYEVLAFTQACQTTNFPDKDTALTAAFGACTVENHPWKTSQSARPGLPFKGGDDESVTFLAPADAYEVSDATELVAAVNAGHTTILLKNGEYTDFSIPSGKTLKLYGESKDVVLYTKNNGGEGADYDFDGCTVEFNNMTLSSAQYITREGENHYPGYARMKGTYNDCVIDGMYVLYGKSEFNYCTLNVTGDTYNIWTWGAGEAKFDHCTFNTDGKSILVYSASCDLTVTNSEFNDSEALAPVKAAIEAAADNTSIKHNITVENVKVNGFAVNTVGINTGTTLWANKNSMSTDNLNVVVNGVDVY